MARLLRHRQTKGPDSARPHLNRRATPRLHLIEGFRVTHGPGGPPINMKMGLSCACTLMERGRHRSVYTLDEVRPFLSLVGNARFEPIYVAPLIARRW